MDRGVVLAALLRWCARRDLPLLCRLGRAVGAVVAILPSRLRHVTARNLELAFPDMSPASRRRLARESLKQTACAVLELGPLWLWPSERVLARVTTVDGEGEWLAALAEGRGAIAMTPHLGAWEVAGLYLSARHAMTTLYRPSRLGLDVITRHGRQRSGAKAVPTDRSGVRALMGALKAGEVVGILPDQDPGPEGGVFAPFFGVPVATITLVSRLAARHGSPVFMLVALREPAGQGYRLAYRRVADSVADPDPVRSATVLNAAVEAAVRDCPEQYLWSYKRFKSRPPGEPRRYS